MNTDNTNNTRSASPMFSRSSSTTEPLNYQEQLRRQLIMNSLENKDYLMMIASQQNKSVEQVKYELKLKLIYGG
ncbi:hypothetical protein SBY92_004505 [Candida maltosa Xu316]